jgi:hypothetical protein
MGRVVPPSCLQDIEAERSGRRRLQMVMEKHHHKSTRRCAHCRQRFLVNPRIGKRHRFCGAPACVRASRATAQKKWWSQQTNRDHFTGPVHVQRVRDWRKAHPHYWRKRRAAKPVLSQQFAVPKKLSAMMRYAALQDMIDTHFALEMALAIISQALRYKIR